MFVNFTIIFFNFKTSNTIVVTVVTYDKLVNWSFYYDNHIFLEFDCFTCTCKGSFFLNHKYYSYLSHTFLIITAEKILNNQENFTEDNFTACLIMCYHYKIKWILILITLSGVTVQTNYYITRLVYYLKQVLFRVNSRELVIEW